MTKNFDKTFLLSGGTETSHHFYKIYYIIMC